MKKTEDQQLQKKKKYVKPAYESEPIFETQAVSCGKFSGQCTDGPGGTS